MKTFRRFLNEKTNADHEEAMLVLHKIYGGLDTAHIEKKNKHSELNVGQAIKDHNYKTLNLVFRTGNESSRLATKGDEFYIVIEFPEYSSEINRKDLLVKLESKSMANAIVKNIETFLSKAIDQFHDKNKDTIHEVRGKDNDEVEARYDTLMKAYANKVEEYKSAVANLDHAGTANMAKQSAANMAKAAIKKEYFGENFKGFLSIINKLPEAKFIANLESESKKKILARLENFYDHYVEK